MTLDVNWTSNLLIALIAWWIAEGSNLIQRLKHKIDVGRLKPFDCPLCLAFWIGTFFYYETHFCKGEMFIDLITGFINGIVCSCIAILISKIYYRL